jgi:GT2 family glycosyltransferase
VFNQLFYTQLCLSRLRDTAGVGVEIIVVDNGSTDGTQEYLNEAFEQGVVDQYVRLAENYGFAVATNIGIERSRCEYVCFSNNDVIYTDDWLKKLLATFEDPECGVASPLRVGADLHTRRMEVAEPAFRNGRKFPAFKFPNEEDIPGIISEAVRLNGVVESKYSGQIERNNSMVAFFCTVFKRDLFDRLGLMSEQYVIGCVEDVDFCRRITERAHLKCVSRWDTFVYHFCSKTLYPVMSSWENVNTLIQGNYKIYNETWGTP